MSDNLPDGTTDRDIERAWGESYRDQCDADDECNNDDIDEGGEE
jgi:hypothetical protein